MKKLEELINCEVEKLARKSYKKVLVYGDVHFPYHDEKAVNILYKYMRDYKPNVVVINGDLVDFYSISDYNKNIDEFRIQEELDLANEHLEKVRKLNPTAKIYFLDGNHERRLQKYLYKHPELHDLEVLRIDKLLNFREHKIKYISADYDYWSKTSGYLELGDVVIMHGDSRLNGASTSKYAGYSAKNTMMTIQKSVVMGHVHRMAIVTHYQYNKMLYGIEHGCLSIKVPQANWQQGFVTFELYDNRLVNPRLHYVFDGKLIEDGKVYKG